MTEAIAIMSLSYVTQKVTKETEAIAIMSLSYATQKVKCWWSQVAKHTCRRIVLGIYAVEPKVETC
mgnify:CR=1 FL=1